MDTIFKQWKNGAILERIVDEYKVRWAGYGKEFDSWVKCSSIRPPVIKRILRRNSIKSKNFKIRKTPEKLEGGDVIHDIVRGEDYVVKINDPFNAQVRIII